MGEQSNKVRRFLVRRALATVVTLFLLVTIVFSLARLQGDPRNLFLTDVSTDADYEAISKELGLDRPVITQYGIFLGQILRGNLGKSLHSERSVSSILLDRYPATLQLALGALIFSVVVALPLGVLSAVKRGTIWDLMGRTFAILGQSLPAFFIGLVFILIFAVYLGWLPTSRRGGLDSFVLPVITMGWVTMAGLLRLLRSSLLEALDSEYIKLARAKGVKGFSIVWKHALRNAIIPPLTFMGLAFSWMVTGSITIETVFAWPGIGFLAIRSTLSSDYPVLQGVVLVVGASFVGISFLVDLLYAYVDPRIRYN